MTGDDFDLANLPEGTVRQFNLKHTGSGGLLILSKMVANPTKGATIPKIWVPLACLSKSVSIEVRVPAWV